MLSAMLCDAVTTPAVVTSEMLQPLITMIQNNTAVLLPVGITILGIIVGIGLIPRIIYKFM